ncbi:MAG TPA: hypothetical protein VGL42_00990 [Opitutaceae bacterium]
MALTGASALRLAIVISVLAVGQMATFWGYSYLLWRGDPDRVDFSGSGRGLLR